MQPIVFSRQRMSRMQYPFSFHPRSPLKQGCYSSLASHPFTGSFEQSPAAATSPEWSPQSHLWMTQTPETWSFSVAFRSSRYRYKHSVVDQTWHPNSQHGSQWLKPFLRTGLLNFLPLLPDPQLKITTHPFQCWGWWTLSAPNFSFWKIKVRTKYTGMITEKCFWILRLMNAYLNKKEKKQNP